MINELRNGLLSGVQAPVKGMIKACPSLYYKKKSDQKIAKYQKIVDSLESMKFGVKEEDEEIKDVKEEVKPLKNVFLNQIKKDGRSLTLRDLVMSQDITELKLHLGDYPRIVTYVREEGNTLVFGTKYSGEYRLIF